MVRQRTFRHRLLVMTAPPVLVALATAGSLALLVDDSGSTWALAALVASVVAAGWSTITGWRIGRSLRGFTAAAEGLADAHAAVARGEREVDDLPVLVAAQEEGPGQAPDDELTRLGRAIDHIGASAVQLAEAQREAVSKGLSTMVMNLARRNQSLLDRQVEYLDELERTEEDPERLSELFRVDHLATRMRRNAESLLVLAGSDPGRRKGAPVPLSDVLRVATGEVENYQHIEIGHIDDGPLPVGAAVDLAHLTAELMENATQFSPPSSTVDVRATRDSDRDRYVVSIRDRGMGLGDRLDAANETLADPPELGLGLGRTLGFMVVGRLARRLDATVVLTTNDDGGTTATVDLPLSLFGSGSPSTDVAAPGAVGRAEVEADPVTTPERVNPTGSAALEKLLGISSTPSPRPDPTPDPTPTAATPPAPAQAPESFAAPQPHPAPEPFTPPEPAPAAQPFTPPEPAPPAQPLTTSEPAPPPEPFTPPEPALPPQPLTASEPAPPPEPFTTPEPVTAAQPFTTPEPAPPAEPWAPPEPVPAGGSQPNEPFSPAAPPPDANGAPAGPTAAPAFPGPVELPPLVQPTRPTPSASQHPVVLPPPPQEPRPAAEIPSPFPPPMPPPETATHVPDPAEPAEPVDWQTTSPFGTADTTWTPPPVTPYRPTPGDQPAALSEALPSGDAFEQGVASLLPPPGRRQTPSDRSTPGGLERRERGASNVPIGEGRPVAAPRRSPEEVRAMLSRYRDGLKGAARDRHVSPWPTDGATPPQPDHRADNEDR